jgi:hypothetical protein
LPPTRKRGGRGRAKGGGDERVSSGFGVVFCVGVYSPFGEFFCFFFAAADAKLLLYIKFRI